MSLAVILSPDFLFSCLIEETDFAQIYTSQPQAKTVRLVDKMTPSRSNIFNRDLCNYFFSDRVALNCGDSLIQILPFWQGISSN